jgi:hypothetical protein
MAKDRQKTPAKAGKSDVSAFLEKVASTPVTVARGSRGKLIIAMDATMSREPSWDHAISIQSEMFDAANDLGGLDVQLVWFRGFGEFHASSWARDANALARQMTAVRCRGGHTQIGKVLAHGLKQTRTEKVNALVYVGDCVEEAVDDLAAIAGEMGLMGLPVFLFQDGRDNDARLAFQEIARLSGGAYCHLDEASASRLKDLLRAVAVYASGGKQALLQTGKFHSSDVKKLLSQLGD